MKTFNMQERLSWVLVQLQLSSELVPGNTNEEKLKHICENMHGPGRDFEKWCEAIDYNLDDDAGQAERRSIFESEYRKTHPDFVSSLDEAIERISK